MLQQLTSVVIDLRRRRIRFEAGGKLVREVFAGVEVLKEAGNGVEVIVDQLNALVIGGSELLREKWRLAEQSFMRCEEGLSFAATDQEFDHRRFEVAVARCKYGL